MSLQIIQDNKGKPSGVFIPINEWKELKKHYRDLEALEYVEPSKEQILKELKEAVQELKAIEQGKATSISFKGFLNEI